MFGWIILLIQSFSSELFNIVSENALLAFPLFLIIAVSGILAVFRVL